MKFLVVLLFIVAAALDSIDFSKDFSIKESAVDNNLGLDKEVIVIHGPFSFIGDEGQPYSFSFIADDTLFQVTIDISGLILKNIFDWQFFPFLKPA